MKKRSKVIASAKKGLVQVNDVTWIEFLKKNYSKMTRKERLDYLGLQNRNPDCY